MTTSTITRESTSKFVTVPDPQFGDLKVHYHEAGTGPVLFCVHGGAPGAFGWGNFGRNMEELSQDFRVIVVDLPGYGLSDKPTIEGGRQVHYSRIFRQMFTELGIEKAHVCGIATGANTALRMALDHPESVDRVIVVSGGGPITLFPRDDSATSRLITDYYADPGPSREKMRAYLGSCLFDKTLITEELIDERYNESIVPEFMVQAPEGRPGIRQHPEPIWQDVHKVENKTLIVYGRENRSSWDGALYMVARMPNAEFHLFSKCGFWVQYEKAEAFNALVKGFLRS